MKIKESIKEYHAKSCLSKTKLWRILEKNPQWFKYCEEHQEADDNSPSLIFGAALHKAVLEYESFFDEYCVAPMIDRRTKAGKEAWQEFLSCAGSRIAIEAPDWAVIQEMRQAISENKYAAYLCSGEVETSYYWVDEMTGLQCQARPDVFKIINGRGLIVDLKTCTSADTDAFRRSAINYGYDLQAAMFITACEKEHRIPCDFVFVAIEKTPPYMINIMQADELLIKLGKDRFREALGIYKECSESGNWYGYNGFSGIINNLSVPAWLAKEVE